jgi:hypothetical protein
MRTVYVVSYNDYDYSENRAVFETEEAAQAYIDEIRNERPFYASQLDIEPVPMF